MCLYDMDKLKEKEKNKLRPIKNAWYHRYFSYILQPKTKLVGNLKDNIVSRFHINKP